MEDAGTTAWQERKKVCLALISVDVVLLAACALFRFVPTLNDEISRRPEYLRALTGNAAQLVAGETHGEAPVIVKSGESEQCEAISLAHVPEYQDAYYVLTYSEKGRYTCITTYVTPVGADELTGAATISENIGQNYGRRLMSPVRAVPIDRTLKVFSNEYLSLLDWRVEPHFPLAPGFAGARTYYSKDAPAEAPGAKLEINLVEVRAEVARRHDRINSLLSAAISVLALFAAVLGMRTWLMYRSFAVHCGQFDFGVTFSDFIGRNVDVLAERTRSAHQQRQEELREQARAERVARHAREELEDRLRALLEIVQDEGQRSRIRECLSRDETDPAAMRQLWLELLPQTGQKPPEERLLLLLEPLKVYCTADRFEQYRKEALQVFEAGGFRAARDFVTSSYQEAKQAARKTREEEEAGQLPGSYGEDS